VSGDSGFEASDERIAHQPRRSAVRSRVTGPIGCHPCVTATITPILSIYSIDNK